jgi:hypothetical protein
MEERVQVAAEAMEADNTYRTIAWVVLLVSAVFLIFWPLLALIGALVGVALAHWQKAQTLRIAGITLAGIAFLIVLFRGVGGFLSVHHLFT